MGPLRLATRGSPLALRQTELVAEACGPAPGPRGRGGGRPDAGRRSLGPARPDRRPGRLRDRGGGGRGRRAGRCGGPLGQGHDLGHVGRSRAGRRAASRRPRDGLVGCALADLPPGGLIATGSARRRAQLAYAAPRSELHRDQGEHGAPRLPGRGRLGHAVVVAVAAMERLGWMHRLTTSSTRRRAAPGRAGRHRRAVPRRRRRHPGALLSAIDDEPSHRAVRAERSVLAGLGGSCTVPVGAWAETAAGSPGVAVHGLVASGDGRVVIRMSRHGDDPELVGAEVAHALLVDGGGSGIDGLRRSGALGPRRGRDDRLPGRRRARGPRAPHPAGGHAAGRSRRRPLRPPGPPLGPGPGAPNRPS
jgi:porphobilinogen deaminase